VKEEEEEAKEREVAKVEMEEEEAKEAASPLSSLRWRRCPAAGLDAS
jgi:hypothetical protein